MMTTKIIMDAQRKFKKQKVSS